MADAGFPNCRGTPLRRNLSAWWSGRVFAGRPEVRRSEGFVTSVLPPLVLAVLAGLLFFARLGCPLLEPEEARYAEIPRQMLAEGRWLEPVLHGEDYLQKPPLLYWLVMLSYQLFGVHDWAARLVSCVTAILIVLVTYSWARRTVGPRAALLSGSILCLSAKFLYLGGMVGMDGLLCFWVITALACAHVALEADTLKAHWWLLSSLCCGLGMLTKGPVAAVLVLGPFAAWTFLSAHRPRIGWWGWLGYLAVAVAVAAPWYVAMGLRAPQATETFFWLHNIVRYMAPFDHEKPAWFYLPGLLFGMFPWSILVFPLVPYLRRHSGRWPNRRPAGLGLFLLVFLSCLTFFSFSGCKRPAYILPALPALSLVLGTFVSRSVPWRSGKRTLRRSPRLIWLATAGTTALALLLATHFCLPDYHRRFGLRGQVRRHAEQAKSIEVACYPRRWDSVSFYLQREVTWFGPNECERLLNLLQERETLLFVKNGKFLADVLALLPSSLEFSPCGRQGSGVQIGIVRPRR